MFTKRLMTIFGVIVLFVVNIGLLNVSREQRIPTSHMTRVALRIVSPFQEAVTHTFRFFFSVWDGYFFLVETTQENQRLRRELDEAFRDLNHCQEAEWTNHRLRALIQFKKEVHLQLIAAEVVADDPSPWFKTIVINKGTRDGVKDGQAVIAPRGVVGRVIEAAHSFAKVLLIIDSNSAVDARVQRTRARGIIEGAKKGSCRLEYLLKNEDIAIGDAVISSGMDGIFPGGLRIGFIDDFKQSSTEMFKEVRVTPYVDFTKMSELFVVTNS